MRKPLLTMLFVSTTFLCKPMPFQVNLSKERFKFSSTHFTIFKDHQGECLHGHNYQVSVDLDFRNLAEDTGLSAEFSQVKYEVDNICKLLDEKVLLPADSPYLDITDNSKNYDVQFGVKFYSFPKVDCVLLDIVNVSSECLAKWVHQKLSKAYVSIGLESLSVTVEESSGQAVTYFLAEDA